MEDVEINGFRLKKGTIVVPQISMVLYDDKVIFSIIGLKIA